MLVKPSMSVNSAVISRISPRRRSAAGSAAMRRTTSGARCCSKLRRSSRARHSSRTKRTSVAAMKVTMATSRRSGRVHQQHRAGHRRDRRAGPGEAGTDRQQARYRRPQPRREHQTEQAKQQARRPLRRMPAQVGRTGNVAAQDRLDRLGLDRTDGVAGEAGVTRRPPSFRRAAADQHDPAGERGAASGCVEQRRRGDRRNVRRAPAGAASHRCRAAARCHR